MMHYMSNQQPLKPLKITLRQMYYWRISSARLGKDGAGQFLELCIVRLRTLTCKTWQPKAKQRNLARKRLDDEEKKAKQRERGNDTMDSQIPCRIWSSSLWHWEFCNYDKVSGRTSPWPTSDVLSLQPSTHFLSFSLPLYLLFLLKLVHSFCEKKNLLQKRDLWIKIECVNAFLWDGRWLSARAVQAEAARSSRRNYCGPLSLCATFGARGLAWHSTSSSP